MKNFLGVLPFWKKNQAKITQASSEEQLFAAGQGVGDLSSKNKKLYHHRQTTKKVLLAPDGDNQDPDSSEVVVGFHLISIPRIMNGRYMTDRRDASIEDLHGSLLFDGLWMMLTGFLIPLLLLIVLLSNDTHPEDIFFIAVAPMLNGFALAFANDKRRAYSVAARWFRVPACFEHFFPVDTNMFVNSKKVTNSRQKYVRKKNAIWLVMFIVAILANSLLMFYVIGIINENISSDISSSAAFGLLCISAYGLFFGFPTFYCLLEGVSRFLAWIRFSEDEIATLRPDLPRENVAADDEVPVSSAPAEPPVGDAAKATGQDDFVAEDDDFEDEVDV